MIPSPQQEFTACLPRHHYSAGVIGLFLIMVLCCAASQRGAAAILELLRTWLPGVVDTPCANTGRLWLLRLGLYELTRPKEQAEDWVWVIDHTLQLGPWKCLVIVGVRLSAWLRDRRPLEHGDLTLLNLTPMHGSTGEQVHTALRQTVAQTGVPVAVVGDGAADLRNGLELLQATHPSVVQAYDVKHKMALLLKKELEADPQWTEFITQTNLTKRQLTQTELAFLVPPSLKGKARYLNVDTLVRWGRRVLGYLEQPQAAGIEVDPARREGKLGWVRKFQPALEHWSQIMNVVQTTEEYIRYEGYHRQAAGELAHRLAAENLSPAAQRIQEAALAFVSEQSAAAQPDGQRLIGSSEVLESLIGKYKQLQSTHSQGGMTAMLLSFGAIVCPKTPEFIQTALTQVRSSDVTDWSREKLGITLQAQRKRAFGRNKSRIQNPRPGN